MEFLNLIKNDSWLAPFEKVIAGRHQYTIEKQNVLTNSGSHSLASFATGYLYFGLHKVSDGWVFREWAPNATCIYLIGTCNGWQKDPAYKLNNIGSGVWEIFIPEHALHHGDLYKLWIEWNGGAGERIPAWCRRVVQDTESKIFSAQVWNPSVPYVFKNKKFVPSKTPLLIYECHIGMSTSKETVGSYTEFRENVLPRIHKAGYNAIQIMAIQDDGSIVYPLPMVGKVVLRKK